MNVSPFRLLAALGCWAVFWQQSAPAATPPAPLTKLDGCTLVEAAWADGDSFPVRLPDGSQQTVRLYGADCIEWHIRDDSDARRLRDQRRYFGITGTATESVAAARGIAQRAAERVRELLAQPFTVHTSFADGRGDSRYSRVYAFVTTSDGRDLATVLVSEGLARAFGVYRETPDKASGGEYRETLRDLELTAATARRGAWALTDWEHLAAERRAQRAEEAELSAALGRTTAEPASINPNNASRDELMSLPGIGEAGANRIIGARSGGPFRTAEDLRRVPGIGPALLERIRPYLRFDPPTPSTEAASQAR